MQELLDIMRRLRAPDGCPWDREQTHESLRPYLLEEAAEAVDAVSEGDPRRLADELGDVLLQVAFHSVIAEEAGTFRYQDVEQAIVQKMVRRHPHVFAAQPVADTEEVRRNWLAIKAEEKAGRSTRLADQIPRALGALAREAKAQKLLEERTVCREEVIALLQQTEDSAEGLALVLSTLVAWARSLGLDPELVLRDHTNTRIVQESAANHEQQ